MDRGFVLKVLLLGNKCNSLEKTIKLSGCEIIRAEKPIDLSFIIENRIRYVVSYGYRYIVNEEIIEYLYGKIINLHISYLPWNKGADPNLWSFLENTPKGVSIHFMDKSIDAGDIIIQERVYFYNKGHTLRTTYDILSYKIEYLFSEKWSDILADNVKRIPQPDGGSYHFLKDKNAYMHLLSEKGWDTPVDELVGKARF